MRFSEGFFLVNCEGFFGKLLIFFGKLFNQVFFSGPLVFSPKRPVSCITQDRLMVEAFEFPTTFFSPFEKFNMWDLNQGHGG